ncbi:MAG: cation transporting ATPase C-terminal domain-containing protein, partial [Cyclobacteriaceae bacterium]|nr:cation transporting ATPase C-terminal domain-containing protein [Cyclobacteriaceae bacterium]
AVSIIFLTFPPIKELFVRNGVPNNEVFLSAFFNVFIFLIIFNSFNARTERLNLVENITLNPLFIQVIGFIILVQVIFTYVGGSILRTVSLESIEWLYVIAIALSIIPIDIIRKLLFRAFGGQTIGV